MLLSGTRPSWRRGAAGHRLSCLSSPYPEDDNINLDEIPEFDFSRAVRGTHAEWAKRAKGHFYEVTDEEDARRYEPAAQPKRGTKRG